MSYLALARKWRPRNFSELVGQTHVRTALENALSQQRLHPALLFSGTRGVGKTTLARIIARSLNCETGITATPCGVCTACQEIDQGRFVDLIEVDAASRTKVDDTRELLDNVPYAPARGRVKVYLIDEVHMLSKSSFNALLKTLEEPPSHVQFLFATTDPQKLPITILSRCLQFNLRRINADEIADRMRFILGEEGITCDDEGLARLARAADGSLRDGLSLLDQAIAFGAGEVKGEAVAQMLGSIERRDLLQLVEAIANQDGESAWRCIDEISAQGLDFAGVLDEFCRLWQRLALGQQVPQALDEVERTDLQPLLQRFDPADVQVFYQIAVHARRDLDWAPDPRSGFEMAVLRVLAFLPEASKPGAAGGGGAASAPSGNTRRESSTQDVAPVQGSERNPATAQPGPQASPPAIADAPMAALTDVDCIETLVEALGLRGSLAVVARGCRIVGSSENRLQLALGAQVQALCTPSTEKNLAAALKQAYGASCALELMLDETQRDTAAGASPQDRFLANPGVKKAMDMFDAELQPGSVRPISNEDQESSIH